jgi:F0F1-type ATP synthase delta subunit
MAPEPRTTAQLPILVSSPADLGRLIRELEVIDESLLQLSLRKGGGEVKMPKTTKLMDQTIQLNKLNLLHKTDRELLRRFLTDIKAEAPVLHISFSVDPSTAFLEKLVTWLRLEINPSVLVTVGLQPSLGVGCVVRSTNKYFDLSLRQNFAKKRELLFSKLVPPEVKA